MNHIVVIGFMGSGKTRVGKKLAQDLHMEFLDVDKKIAHDMKMPISDLMSKFGEPFYRALETKTIKDMLEVETPTVLSVGSGLPIQEQNHKYLKKLGVIIYLEASVETLKERLSGDNKRPALRGVNLTEKITKMLASRAPVYEKLADIKVVTGEVTFHELVKQIESKLENYKKNS
ncbi:MAG: shikimate kinase [Clostridiales bacterium]|nr:shikimate kinase [Lachnospiraceae bacterium]MDD6618658.1 shikimate kinase [Clostridiales bacterium]MDY4771863.1 shikimate kinase [Lachnospiraceae bacterium]